MEKVNWNGVQKKQYSAWQLAVIAAIGMIAGTALNFIIHELSHMLTLLLVGGTVEEIVVGTSSFVSGYVEKDAIALVAMSSIVIPLAVAYAIFKINIPFFNLLSMGFTIPNIVNCLFGLFASFFITGPTRQTYDVALAYDNTPYPMVIIAITTVAFVINVPLLIVEMKRIVDFSDKILIAPKKTSGYKQHQSFKVSNNSFRKTTSYDKK